MHCFKRHGPGVRDKRAKGKGQSVKILCFMLYALCFILTPEVTAQDNYPFPTAMGQFQYASLLFQQGYYTVAAKEYGKVIERFPFSPILRDAHYMMAEAYYQGGLYQEALGHYKQFLVNFPDYHLTLEAKARMELCRIRQEEVELFSLPTLPVRKIPKWSGIRAVQIALFEGKTYDEIASEIGKLKERGVDTIIVRVFQNRGDRFYPFVQPKAQVGVYFKTTHAPVVEDILGKVVEMGHQRGLKVFAWMTTRYADYDLEERYDLRCKAYDFRTGGIIPCKGLDLFNDRAVDHLVGLYRDLTKYPIDGILFQDDLVLRHNEGFGEYAQALFFKEIGYRLDPSKLYQGVYENGKGGYYVSSYTQGFWRWASWKNKRLLYVAKRLKEAVREVNPDTRFAINLMYETVSNPPMALAWLSQSLDEATKVDFDYYAIMAYHNQMQGELGKGLPYVKTLIGWMTRSAVQRVRDPTKVLMKVQTVDWTTSRPLPDEETIEVLNTIDGVDRVSIGVVPYRRDFPFNLLADVD